MSPETRLIVEILLLVCAAAVGLVVRTMLRRSEDVATEAKAALQSTAAEMKATIEKVAGEVHEIGAEVQRHAISLASGNEKFRGIERRLDEVEAELKKIANDGCARGRDCLRGGGA